MSVLFTKLSKAVERIELVTRQFGVHKEPILPEELREDLIENLIEESLKFRHYKTVLIDVMKNGCVGYNYFDDLSLISTLHDDLLMNGPDCSDDKCPPCTEEVIEAIQAREKQLLED